MIWIQSSTIAILGPGGKLGIKNYNYELGLSQEMHLILYPSRIANLISKMGWLLFGCGPGISKSMQINEDTSQAGRHLNMAQNGMTYLFFWMTLLLRVSSIYRMSRVLHRLSFFNVHRKKESYLLTTIFRKKVFQFWNLPGQVY